MRWNEFRSVLNEEGISRNNLLKYGGKYLDILINMIAAGKDVDLEGKAREKYGKTAKFDPSEARRLSQLFYGEDSPVEDKAEVNTDDNNYLIPKGAVPKSVTIKLDGVDEYVPTGQIFKTPEMKGSKKDFNTGDIGEAFLGAACAAKFKKLGEEITEKDVLSFLNSMKVTEEGKNKRGLLNTSAGIDTLEFVLVLNQTSFGALENAINAGNLPPEMIGLNRSAVKWANTSAAVKEAVAIAVEDPNKNKIIVNSDGVADQKGTKADLFLTIDDSTLELLSAKAGDVKQFGQVPGNSYEKVQTLFKSIFGVDIKEDYIDRMNGSVAKDNYPIFKEIYKDVAQELEQELAGNTPREVTFLERLHKGISHHAALNDPKVSMVILKATPNSPGFKELTFGPELKEAMKQFDLQVQYQADPPKIQIHGKPLSQDAQEEVKLSGNTMLIQVRTNMKGDSKGGYIRSLIEMGGLLKAIAAVEYEEKTDTVVAKPQQQSANDPNASI